MRSIILTTIVVACSGLAAKAQVAEKPAEDKAEAPKGPKRIMSKAKVLYGAASFYADKFNGRQTATGELYDHGRLTAACNRLPLNTWIRVTNLKNKKFVIVRVNDRLHHRNPRLVDMSKTAAQKLGFIRAGLAQVKVEVLGSKKPRDLGYK